MAKTKKIVAFAIAMIMVFALSLTAFAGDIKDIPLDENELPILGPGTELAIVTQPVDWVGEVGETATVKVAAKGYGLSYKWQYSTDGTTWRSTSCTTDTYTTDMTVAKSGRMFRVIVSDERGGSITSDVATISVLKKTELKITKQPVDWTGEIGETATVSVTAEGEGLTYKWQYSTDGTAWRSTSNLTDTYTTDMTAAKNGRMFRCVVSDANGESVISDSAKITVKASTDLKITKQPTDWSGAVGETATVSVTAEGEGLTYKWQYSVDKGTTWKSTSCITNTYTTDMTAAKNGRMFRCIVSDANGNSVTSNSATITVTAAATPLKITKQPVDWSGAVGETATVSVTATGEGLTYKWQYSVDKGTTWKSTSNLTATYTTDMTAAKNGRMFRCIVSDANGNSVTSNSATITVTAAATPLKITKQPVDWSGAVGETATVSVTATGEGLTYKWQYSVDKGTTWKSTSNLTATYTTDMTAAKSGRMFRCIVSDANGNSVTSNAVTITVAAAADPITITAQPTDWSGAVGEIATVSVTATGKGLTYKWQYSVDKGTTWKSTSCTTNTYTTDMTAGKNGRMFRCIITDADGNTVTSNAATITVAAAADPITITKQPTDWTGAIGETATVSVTAIGKGLTYKWQYSVDKGTTWKSTSCTTNTYTTDMTAGKNGRMFRCIITDADGNTKTSNAAAIYTK